MKNKAHLFFPGFFLVFISLILFSLSNPGIFFSEGCGIFAWFSYVPIFILISQSCKSSYKAAFLFGFLYGSLGWLLLCWWLSSFGPAAILFVISVYGIFFGIFFVILKILFNFFPKARFLIFPAAFTLFEIFRSSGFFGFSYGVAGYTQYKNKFALSSARFVGVYGISFLIFLFNSCFSEILISIRDKIKNHNKIKKQKILLILGIFLFLSASFLFQKSQKNRKTEKISVNLIQNFSADESDNIDDFENDVKNLIKLSENSLRKNQADLVVWPETAVVPDIFYHLNEKNDSRRKKIAENLVSYVSSKKSDFLIGNNHREKSVKNDGEWEYFNSALNLKHNDDNRLIFNFYNKNHLVPFTEEMPKIIKNTRLKFLEKLISSDDYSPGKEIKLFSIDKNHLDVKYGVLICFEDSFWEIARKQKKLGAKFLVNITDDSWAKSEAAQNLHLSMSVLRAAENQIPVVRSSISGETCLIDAAGNVKERLEPFTDGFLNVQVEIIP